MSEYDFPNFLSQSSDEQILLMTEVCLTSEYLRHLVISQPSTILNKINSDFDLPINYEVAELIHRINPIELSGVLKKHISREVLTKELNLLRKETQHCIIKYYMEKDTKNIILKLKNLDRVIENEQSIYSKILDLNDEIELCKETLLSPEKKDDVIEYRLHLKKQIKDLAIEGIREELGETFKIVVNGERIIALPSKINIHDVYKNTIIFDFPVGNGMQEVIYNRVKLKEGNYFCLIWLSDLLGFPDSERFITLFHYNIKSISPLIGEMYVYDSIWNKTEVSGVIFIQGEEVLEPKYSTVEIISQEYFKAYRINPAGEKDNNELEIAEGWEYYNKEGKRLKESEII